MTPKQFYSAYKDSDREKIVRVCRAAQTSFDNFKQIAISKGAVGKTLAKRISESSGGEMSILEILYPEDYEKAA